MNKAEERYEKIIEILKQNPIVTVNEFAEELGVSTETIRKDLCLLAEQGKIVRIHGGAALTAESSVSSAFQFREGVNRLQKQQIGVCASKLVKQGDSLIIEGSTTTVEFVKVLLKQPELLQSLIIVTNSAYILTLLEMGRLCRRVFFLGGWMNEKEQATKGQFTVAQLQNFHVDKCFLSGAALGKNLMLSSYYEDDMLFQRQAMESAAEKILLLEAGKYPASAVLSVAGLEEFDTLVTNISFEEPEARRLLELGLQVIYA